jgi:hypothetical protein
MWTLCKWMSSIAFTLFLESYLKDTLHLQEKCTKQVSDSHSISCVDVNFHFVCVWLLGRKRVGTSDFLNQTSIETLATFFRPFNELLTMLTIDTNKSPIIYWVVHLFDSLWAWTLGPHRNTSISLSLQYGSTIYYHWYENSMLNCIAKSKLFCFNDSFIGMAD